MAYDYNPAITQLELPNPYRVDNSFRAICAALLVISGVTALVSARAVLLEGGAPHALLPIIVGIALLAAGIGHAMHVAQRLRFFFGRGRPKSLAPDVDRHESASSRPAEDIKATLRQNALHFDEPRGAVDVMLHHLLPTLITAPRVLRNLMQSQFVNALALVAIATSYLLAWGLFGDDATRPLVSLVYFGFAAFVALRPLLGGTRVHLSVGTLVVLAVVALVGPVTASLYAPRLPAVGFSVAPQMAVLLGASMTAVVLALLAARAQIAPPAPVDRSVETRTLSFNGPPAALFTELQRRLQDGWSQGIPNRTYTWIEPDAQASAGSGQFAGELLEETQPLPLGGSEPQTLASALRSPRHRWLVALDAFATVLVAAAAVLALRYIHDFDLSRLADGGIARHGAGGTAAICLAVSTICLRNTSVLWGRFTFESVLLWVETQGTWQRSRLATGNTFRGRIQTSSDVVRIESMTLRVWRARIETVSFAKDGARQIVAMFATGTAAETLADSLCEFVRSQSAVFMPHADEDRRRLQTLGAVEESMLSGDAYKRLSKTQRAAAESTTHLADDSTSGNVRAPDSSLEVMRRASTCCPACAVPVEPHARFCSACGAAQGDQA